MSRRVVAAAVLGVVVLAVALLVVTRRDGNGDGLAEARRLLADDGRFDTAYDAGDTFAVVGQLLQEDGESCRRDDATRPRCAHLLSASAAAQVMAYRVLDCTSPGRFDARARLTEHLAALAAGQDPGDPPVPPDCD